MLFDPIQTNLHYLQVLVAAKYILPLIGLLAGLMTVLCSLTASGVAVPGLTAIPDSTKLLVADFLDSGVISFSLTAVLTLHLGFLILKVCAATNTCADVLMDSAHYCAAWMRTSDVRGA